NRLSFLLHWPEIPFVAVAVPAVVGSLVVVMWWRRHAIRALLTRKMALTRESDDGIKWATKSWMRLLFIAYCLSAVSQSILVITHWAVFQTLNIDISFAAVIWVVLLVSMSLLLPISLDGIGLQEGLYVVILSSYGVPATLSLGVAVLIRLLIVMYSLAGGILSLWWSALKITNQANSFS